MEATHRMQHDSKRSNKSNKFEFERWDKTKIQGYVAVAVDAHGPVAARCKDDSGERPLSGNSN